jgi:two-component system, LytTR family, response regulator
MIKAIALDDEPPALQVISKFCSRIDFINLEKIFSKTEEALSYINAHTIDLIFLDINMPSVSGIDFYKKIPYKAMVIFTTAYSEYAIDAFNLHAIDYLLKPFTFQRFFEATGKANEYFGFINQSQHVKEKHLLIRSGYSLLKINIDDILFIEGLDDYLKIHLTQQKPIIARLTMKALLEKLPADIFVRVHRSYIVSLTHIEKLRNKVITIAGTEIPVGISYEAAFMALFNK